MEYKKQASSMINDDELKEKLRIIFSEEDAKTDDRVSKMIILDGGVGKVIQKKKKGAKYTVSFENELFLKAKSIAYVDRNVSFNGMVNEGVKMWIRKYVKENGSKSHEELMEKYDQINKEYLLTQRQNITKNIKS